MLIKFYICLREWLGDESGVTTIEYALIALIIGLGGVTAAMFLNNSIMPDIGAGYMNVVQSVGVAS